jgi:CPA1 family monovalent cation:H+ antiporter
VFVLTGLTFIFIGLSMREIIRENSPAELANDALSATAILVATIAVRFLWVFPAAWLPRALSAKLKARDPMPPWSHLLVISWTGMRGVVSLAAALALPEDFPARKLVLFLVFCVILGTLVVQGATLPWLIRALKLSGGGRALADQEIDARLGLLVAANLHLDHQQAHGVSMEEVEYLRSHFRGQAESWLSRLQLEEESLLEHQSGRCHSTYLNVVSAQRDRLHQMLKQGLVEEAIVQKIERELDMDEARVHSVRS